MRSERVNKWHNSMTDDDDDDDGGSYGAILIVDIRSTVCEHTASSFDTLLSHYIFINLRCISMGENTWDVDNQSHYERLRGANFPVSLSLHINLSHEWCRTD